MPTDFGTANTAGTPGYVTQETLLHDQYSFASDIFALGRMFAASLQIDIPEICAEDPKLCPSLATATQYLDYLAAKPNAEPRKSLTEWETALAKLAEAMAAATPPPSDTLLVAYERARHHATTLPILPHPGEVFTPDRRDKSPFSPSSSSSDM